MNISLSVSSKSGKVGVGLNRRGADNKNVSSSKSNVFDEDDGDDDADDDVSGRGTVNRELAAEQAALRKRAAAAAAGKDPSVYDYDGVYDTFHDKPAEKKTKDEEEQQQAEERKSRYIGDLLKAAEHRKRQRDVVFERKLAKEQEAEAAEFANQERFVTKAYKRKLQERQLWQEQEDARAREEEAKDVTKAKGGKAWVNFYGNLSRNVTLGGSKLDDDDKGVEKEDGVETEKQNEENSILANQQDDESSNRNKRNANSRGEPAKSMPKSSTEDDAVSKFSFLDGFEPASRGDADEEERTRKNGSNHDEAKPQNHENPNDDAAGHSNAAKSHLDVPTTASPPPPSPAELRKQRKEKVAQARIRYFQRKGIVSTE
jgi:coiled-coil domain-containing protein 55